MSGPRLLLLTSRLVRDVKLESWYPSDPESPKPDNEISVTRELKQVTPFQICPHGSPPLELHCVRIGGEFKLLYMAFRAETSPGSVAPLIKLTLHPKMQILTSSNGSPQLHFTILSHSLALSLLPFSKNGKNVSL